METKIFAVALWVFLQLTWVAGNKTRAEVEKEILQKIFMTSKFHMYVKPEQSDNQKDEPLQVSVSLYVLNTDIDIRKQECDVQMYFRQEWNDSRLAYDDQGKINLVSLHDAVGIWTPDLFFVNEKSGHVHMVTKPNTFVRIHPEGKVLYSQRLGVKLSCSMDLRKYPFDTQTCTIPIESYGHTANDLMLKWKPETTFGMNEPSGYRISYSTLEEVVHVGKNSYSRIELHIHFSRLIYTIFLHVFIPLSLLVLVSWVSFWLPPSSLLPRMVTSIILTFSTLVYMQSIKELSYFYCHLTALDVWTGFSCLLIFGAVFENIYVAATQNKSPPPGPESNPNQKDVEVQKMNGGPGSKLRDVFAGENSSLDRIARFVFPSAFTLFNIIYLAYYLV